MTTLVIDLTPKFAQEVAKGANAIDGGISHEAFAVRAMQIVLRSMFGPRMGRPIGYRPSRHSQTGRQLAATKIKARVRAKRARRVR